MSPRSMSSRARRRTAWFSSMAKAMSDTLPMTSSRARPSMPAHRVVDPHAAALDRVGQRHADRRGVEALAEEVLGGQAPAIGLALGGDVEDGAAEMLPAAVGQR